MTVNEKRTELLVNLLGYADDLRLELANHVITGFASEDSGLITAAQLRISVLASEIASMQSLMVVLGHDVDPSVVGIGSANICVSLDERKASMRDREKTS